MVWDYRNRDDRWLVDINRLQFQHRNDLDLIGFEGAELIACYARRGVYAGLPVGAPHASAAAQARHGDRPLCARRRDRARPDLAGDVHAAGVNLPILGRGTGRSALAGGVEASGCKGSRGTTRSPKVFMIK